MPDFWHLAGAIAVGVGGARVVESIVDHLRDWLGIYQRRREYARTGVCPICKSYGPPETGHHCRVCGAGA